MLACLVLNCPFFITVPNCPRCQIVRFSLRCQIVRGAKLSTLHCGAKLSAVPNCPLYTLGAKLSGAKLSAVPNCPRCQIVRGAKLSYNPYPYLWYFSTLVCRGNRQLQGSREDKSLPRSQLQPLVQPVGHCLFTTRIIMHSTASQSTNYPVRCKV